MHPHETGRLPIAELLSAGTINLTLSAADRTGLLAELVAAVPELADRAEARQTLLSALEEREQLCSTGVGDGIAIPHARNALVGLVEKPVLVFGRHMRGMDFGSVDGKRTKLFFLLVAPNVTQHLKVLARLSRLLRNAALRRTLLKAESPDQVIVAFQTAEGEWPR
jgi:mannitol/fructose-specific phosphotransferase system IIA component (Ntr-type)